MNLCPCGKRGDARRVCRCTPLQIQTYVGRLSGPLLDRIDIHVEAPPVEASELRRARTGEPSAVIRERVVAARERQRQRFAGRGSPVNAAMTSRDLEIHCRLDDLCERTLRVATLELGLSARANTRVLKVARTIADLDASDEINQMHLSEAISYRIADRKPDNG